MIECVFTAGSSKGHSVTEQPPADSADRRVTDVLDEDVLGVLDGHRSDLQHREAGLGRELGKESHIFSFVLAVAKKGPETGAANIKEGRSWAG